ncbi:TlpA family protein disulfide reductase [Mucilaginibacter litoreus]|uniref:TlpA family protein disulfide reductase n=1 Tax=Mucilaginibacter litoreus TaxID=1048221 RepID=A0ABW3AR84_9SPHI
MKKLSLILFALCHLMFQTIAQKKTTVIFRYELDSLKKDSFYLSVKKPFDLRVFGEEVSYNGKIVSVNRQNGFIETKCQFDIPSISCGYLSSGFGYKTFVIPGDSIIVNIVSHSKPTVKLHDKYARPWFNDLTIQGKNQFIYSLFDSLANKYGALGWSSGTPYKKTENLSDFCTLVSNNYFARLKYLDNYIQKYHISDVYAQLAKAEIYAVYIDDLLKPLGKGIRLETYPESYKLSIVKANFNDPLVYFKTSDYSSIAYTYASCISRQKSKDEPYSNADFISIYNLIKKKFTDTIKDHLLTQHLSFFLSNPQIIYPSFDSLLTDYKSVCHNQLYRRFIDSSYSTKKSQILKKYSVDDAILSKIMSLNGQSITVKGLFNSKPVLIICWASWCVPCIEEMPYEKQLQRQLKDKVDFVYLSFDKNKNAWQSKSKSLKLIETNYLMSENFTSAFARFYQISSLPYYLLYDRKHRLLKLDGIRPSDPQFKEALEKIE